MQANNTTLNIVTSNATDNNTLKNGTLNPGYKDGGNGAKLIMICCCIDKTALRQNHGNR